MAKTNSNPTRKGCNTHAQLLFTLRGESRVSCKAAVILNSNWALEKQQWLKALAPHSPLEPTYFLLRGLGEESEEPGTSEILPGKQPAMWARGGGGSAQSQGRGVPGSAGPGRSILAQAPAALGPGRALPCARPRSSLSTRSSPGFPRVSRLPAGRAGALKAPRRLAGAGRGPKQGRHPASPPVAASPLGPRVFLLSAPDAEPERPWPAPQVVRESKPHAKHLQGGRPDPRVPASR